MNNPSSMIMGIVEVAYSSEYFTLSENNWDTKKLSKEMTLLRVYDSTHELCLVTRLEENELSLFLLFGTYEYTTNELIHNAIFCKKLPFLSVKGKNHDDIIQIICEAFAERKYHIIVENENTTTN